MLPEFRLQNGPEARDSTPNPPVFLMAVSRPFSEAGLEQIWLFKPWAKGTWKWPKIPQKPCRTTSFPRPVHPTILRLFSQRAAKAIHPAIQHQFPAGWGVRMLRVDWRFEKTIEAQAALIQVATEPASVGKIWVHESTGIAEVGCLIPGKHVLACGGSNRRGLRRTGEFDAAAMSILEN